MFGWLRRRKNQENFHKYVMEGFIEKNNELVLLKSLRTIGYMPEPESNPLNISASAAAHVVREIAKVANDPIEDMVTDNDRFVSQMFALVFANHTSHFLKTSLEQCAIISLINLHGIKGAENSDYLFTSYNELSKDDGIIILITKISYRWITVPDKSNFDSLVKIYRSCKGFDV